jgi:hypothetical protein
MAKLAALSLPDKPLYQSPLYTSVILIEIAINPVANELVSRWFLSLHVGFRGRLLSDSIVRSFRVLDIHYGWHILVKAASVSSAVLSVLILNEPELGRKHTVEIETRE